MKALLLSLLVCLACTCGGQTVALAVSTPKPTAPATPHFSMVLPVYEVKYQGNVLLTDPRVVWIDTALTVGDTLKLSDTDLRIDKATLSYTMGEDVFEVDLKGNVITKKFKELLESAYTEKGALLFLDLVSCIDHNGQPVKKECSYRLKFY